MEIGTDSDNELLDGRVGELLKDVRRYTTFIRDILARAEPQMLFSGKMMYNIMMYNIEVEKKFPLTHKKVFSRLCVVQHTHYTTRIISQNQDHDEMGYAWLDIYHSNPSIENKIMSTEEQGQRDLTNKGSRNLIVEVIT